MNNNLIILNDKLTQKVFNLKNLVDDEGTIDFDIDETGKKKFLTSVTITPAKGELLDAYDAQIFSYLVSAQQAGAKSVTVREIFVGIGGSERFPQEQREKILDSVQKLTTCYVKVKVQCAFIDKMHYKTDKNFKDISDSEGDYKQVAGSLLPCKVEIDKVKGRKTEKIVFLSDSPLFSIAKMKNQLSAVDAKLIKVPNLKIVDSAVKLTTVLLTKINSIKRSWKPNEKIFGRGKDKHEVNIANRLKKTILLEKLFDACDLPTNETYKTTRFRAMIERILNHFKDCKFIKQWQFRKQGGSFYAIDFDFDAEI